MVQGRLTYKGFQVSRGAAFAVLNVGPAIAACQTESNVDIQFTVLGENHDIPHRHFRLHCRRHRHRGSAGELGARGSSRHLTVAG